jgi:hypothetical protein
MGNEMMEGVGLEKAKVDRLGGKICRDVSLALQRSKASDRGLDGQQPITDLLYILILQPLTVFWNNPPALPGQLAEVGVKRGWVKGLLLRCMYGWMNSWCLYGYGWDYGSRKDEKRDEPL